MVMRSDGLSSIYVAVCACVTTNNTVSSGNGAGVTGSPGDRP